MSADTQDGNPFDFLFKAEPRAISAMLAAESPSTAAVVIARLPRLLAAKVLADFPGEARGKIVAAMREPRTVPADMLTDIAAGFREKLSPRKAAAPLKPVPASQAKTFADMLGNGAAVGAAPQPERHAQRDLSSSQPTRGMRARKLLDGAPPPPSPGGRKVTYGGSHVAAALVRYLSPEVRHQLRDEEPGLFAQLSQFMFTFDDLLKTDIRSLQALMAEVSDRQLAMALKVAAPELRQHILSCVSPRRAELLDAEIDRGQVRISEIEQAQEAIVSLGMAMQSKGRILLDPESN